jgi:predicted solute-binding protein
MVVAREAMTVEDLKGKTIAIPGKLTTAFLALQLCMGKGTERSQISDLKSEISNFKFEVVPFDQILAQVCDGKFDAGLIIHEGQLTYQQTGLHLVVDLGKWWYGKTNLPLPLGGNCIRKNLGPRVCQEVTDISSDRSATASITAAKPSIRASVRARSGSGAGRPLRRDVRERLDARLRTGRSRSDRAIAQRGIARGAGAARREARVRHGAGLNARSGFGSRVISSVSACSTSFPRTTPSKPLR